MKNTIGKIKTFQDDFQAAYRLQGKFHWSHLAYVDKTLDPLSRVAVVASKKAIDKRAVLRNRAKRRLRPLMKQIAKEWLDSQHPTSQTPVSMRWIIRPKKSLLSANVKDLENDVRLIFEKLVQQNNAFRLKPRRGASE